MANRIVYIKSKVYEDLLKLAKKYPSRIICGFIIGYKENNCFYIEDFHLFPAHVGPKIHFKPIWKGYYDAKDYITKFMCKEIIGEFHTHPDGNKELTEKDKQILKWLGAKIMVLVTPEDIIPIEYISPQKNQPATYNKLDIDVI